MRPGRVMLFLLAWSVSTILLGLAFRVMRFLFCIGYGC